MAVSVDASPSSAPSLRVSSLILTAASAFAAVVLYAPVVTGLAWQWVDDSDAAYGAVVALAAVLVFTQRLPRVRTLPLCGSAWGLVPLLIACALYIVGTLAADVFLVRLSLPVFGAAALLFVAGSVHVRALAAPLVLCVVAIPLPSAFVTEVTMPLQLLASQSAAGMLTAVGVPVVRDGNILTLSSLTLEVAQACNGMRSLVTLFALVAVAATLGDLPVRRVVLLAAATVPVALVGNGLRVAVTALLASWIGESAVRGVPHDATGWAAFVLMFGALAALAWGQIGVRSGSDPDGTGVRSGSDPGRTGVRSGSDRGQTGVRVA